MDLRNCAGPVGILLGRLPGGLMYHLSQNLCIWNPIDRVPDDIGKGLSTLGVSAAGKAFHPERGRSLSDVQDRQSVGSTVEEHRAVCRSLPRNAGLHGTCGCGILFSPLENTGTVPHRNPPFKSRQALRCLFQLRRRSRTRCPVR